MARDEAMHQRLQVWAQWLALGDGSGYPTMSVLHEDWSPPSPGLSPSMKVAHPSSARQTHRVMQAWSARLRNTVFLVYVCPSMPVSEWARRLECSESAVHARIENAHLLLRKALDEFRHMEKVV
jgi:DNA-directed RNA polymerase specialized sigma24 family protein